MSQSTLSHIHYKQGLVNVVTPVCVSARQNYRDLFDGGSYLFHAMVTTRARDAPIATMMSHSRCDEPL